MTAPRPYSELQSLEHVYLEDTYVLRIRWADDALIFWLEAILTEQHPDYFPPKPGEQYCYRRCLLAFRHPREVQWQELDTLASADAAGETDLGNIDTFVDLGGRYHLRGGWGEVIITGPPPVLEDWPATVPDNLFRFR